MKRRHRSDSIHRQFPHTGGYAWVICSLFLLLLSHPNHARTPVQNAPNPTTESLADQVNALGAGLRFLNAPVPDGAKAPEVGAEHVYARTYSANARNSPVGIEIWIYGKTGAPLHRENEAYLNKVYRDIYGWDPDAWKGQLGEREKTPEILREKSDFFWESLAQQLAERVLGETITPALYRFGPQCIDEKSTQCQDDGIPKAHRVVVRTFLDARRDPMNPVTRSITYSVQRAQLADPELIFELQVPNGLQVAGPHQEVLDFRPRIAGKQDAVGDIRIWAHIPKGTRARTQNFDYPDYNLVFVPLRHLVVQREVTDPKTPSTGADYPDQSALIAHTKTLVAKLRTPEGGQAIAAELRPFLSEKYYYMFEAGGQGIVSYRNYILGETAGIGRGLNPDFGRIELALDGKLAATFPELNAER